MKKICFVSTEAFTIKWHMLSNINYLNSNNYSIDIIYDGIDNLYDQVPLNINIIRIPVKRKISIFNDFRTLVKLYFIFHKKKYCSVHSIMPKSGLLAMTAAYFAGIPNRTHTFTGQVWSNKSGLFRLLLKSFDSLIAFFSTHILTDSFSQKNFLITNKVVKYNKIEVLGSGSVAGVDLEKFKLNKSTRVLMRDLFKINNDDLLILYVGRINSDKGIDLLLEVFQKLVKQNLKYKLCIVGAMEEDYDIKFNKISQSYPDNFFYAGKTSSPQNYMWAADLLCVPSYREGFGTVVIEAAVAGIPSIGSNIYGLEDAIVNNITGLLFEPGNTFDLERKIQFLFNNPSERLKMGEASMIRAKNKFSSKIIGFEFKLFYDQKIKNKK